MCVYVGGGGGGGGDVPGVCEHVFSGLLYCITSNFILTGMTSCK